VSLAVHDFADVIDKFLVDQMRHFNDELIKCDASRHERLAGRIQAYQDVRQTLQKHRKSWTMRDFAQEDE
jgi:hypothetical protein